MLFGESRQFLHHIAASTSQPALNCFHTQVSTPSQECQISNQLTRLPPIEQRLRQRHRLVFLVQQS
jgi:hypothetical protein